MDHSHHSGMSTAAGAASSLGEAVMPMRCKMNMVWNYDLQNICLVFPSLQITSPFTKYFYLSFLVVLSATSEILRLSLTRNDSQLRHSLRSQLGLGYSLPHHHNSPSPRPGATSGSAAMGRRTSENGGNGSGTDEPLLRGRRDGAGAGSVRLPWSIRVWRSAGYTAWMTISSYLMLILMSYNAYLIGSVLLGAFLGHLYATKDFDITLPAGSEEERAGCH
ncbi:hypothetical protein T439DRAFT_329316 [Meredithblackwellia eburnea MCA 4105]